MAGGLMQLVAYGAQDVYLTGNPKVTFFQAVYRRHTNFAMENIEQTINGTAADSGRVSVTVARNGDLVADMYVEMESEIDLSLSDDSTNPSNEWVAERAIKDVELSIGGQRIDKHYQTWWRLYSELYLDNSKKTTWGKMTTGVDGAKVYLPLIFFFNRNPGLALPLIALQYHEVRLDFDLTSDFDEYIRPSSFKVYANYIYLDTEERRRFAQKGHEYLIEQVQHTGTDTLSSGSNQKRLSFNHPVKELVWCLSQSTKDHNNLWNFTKLISGTAAPQASTDIANATAAASTLAALDFDAGNCPKLLATTSSTAWDEDACTNMTDMKLVLNGQDRFKEQGSKYFNSVQPYNHHSGSPMPGIYSYSFALKPEEHQPTGTCNFSRIDNAQVAITAGSGTNVTLNMFAVNYNVLRIQSGMGGLAFSN
jgi:hypothetical protein